MPWWNDNPSDRYWLEATDRNDSTPICEHSLPTAAVARTGATHCSGTPNSETWSFIMTVRSAQSHHARSLSAHRSDSRSSGLRAGAWRVPGECAELCDAPPQPQTLPEPVPLQRLREGKTGFDNGMRTAKRRLCRRKRTRLRTGCQRPRPSFCRHRRADPGGNITGRPAAIPQEGAPPFLSHPGDKFRSLA